MKIYTKTGDKGSTSLFGGKRVDKDDIRIESYGTVDELNSFIGLLITQVTDKICLEALFNVQNRLFTIGSSLASDPDKNMITPDISESDITQLELMMDEMDKELLPLKNFILPSGSKSIAYAHICRTICRRAERRVISLSKLSKVDHLVIIYLNRLSDYFFTLSRYVGKLEGITEVAWIPRKK